MDITRVSTASGHQQAIDLISQNSISLSQTQLKISSGLNINTPADDPVGASQLISMQQEEASLEQYDNNIQIATSQLEATDTQLSTAIDNLQRIRALSIQANSGTLSTQDRQAISNEIDARIGDLASLLNETFNGQYLFSGFKVNSPAVTLQSNGSYHYTGDEGSQTIQVGNKRTVTVGYPAKSTFFKIPSQKAVLTSYAGQASQSSTPPGLQMAGSTLALRANDLNLNGINIPAASSDGVSTSDSNASAIAIANAINSQAANYSNEATLVTASPEPNVYNLGTFTPGPLTAGELTLNGVSITDPLGTETSVMAAINGVTSTTGIQATQPAGPGGNIVLTAQDGRNIELQTSGTSTNTDFSNYSLASTQHNVQVAQVTLNSVHPFNLAGNAPQRANLSPGTFLRSQNIGTGSLSNVVIAGVNPALDSQLPLTQSVYTIKFNPATPAPNYSIYRSDQPNTPLAGFSNVPYVDGAAISVEGLSATLSGSPMPGDSFLLQMTPTPYQDAFSILQDLSQTISLDGSNAEYPNRLNYGVAIGLQGIDALMDSILLTRAQIGTTQNIVQDQTAANNRFIFSAKTTMSRIQDLDYAQAISVLTSLQMAIEAGMKSYVQTRTLSLFDYIK